MKKLPLNISSLDDYVKMDKKIEHKVGFVLKGYVNRTSPYFYTDEIIQKIVKNSTDTFKEQLASVCLLACLWKYTDKSKEVIPFFINNKHQNALKAFQDDGEVLFPPSDEAFACMANMFSNTSNNLCWKMVGMLKDEGVLVKPNGLIINKLLELETPRFVNLLSAIVKGEIPFYEGEIFKSIALNKLKEFIHTEPLLNPSDDKIFEIVEFFESKDIKAVLKKMVDYRLEYPGENYLEKTLKISGEINKKYSEGLGNVFDLFNWGLVKDIWTKKYHENQVVYEFSFNAIHAQILVMEQNYPANIEINPIVKTLKKEWSLYCYNNSRDFKILTDALKSLGEMGVWSNIENVKVIQNSAIKEISGELTSPLKYKIKFPANDKEDEVIMDILLDKMIEYSLTMGRHSLSNNKDKVLEIVEQLNDLRAQEMRNDIKMSEIRQKPRKF